MTGFLSDLPISDAIKCFVDAKLKGNDDTQAISAARGLLQGAVKQALDSDKLKQWKPLALPLSDLLEDGTGTVVPLGGPLQGKSLQTGAWTWAFGAQAELTLTADVLDAAQMGTLGLPVRSGFLTVRYAAKGTLGATLDGTASAGAWGLSAGASASGNAAIEWYIAARQSERLGLALVAAVPFMAPPMDLQAQLARAGDFDYWGCSVDLDGQLQASLGAKASFTGSGWTWGFDGDKAKLGFSLGASANAKLAIGGKFRLRSLIKSIGSVDGQERYGLEVALERLSTSSRSLALELSAGLDATALAASADAWLRRKLPDPAKYSDELAILTHPGTALAEALEKELGKALTGNAFKPLLLVAAGFGDPEEAAQTLASALSARLIDLLDRASAAIATGGASAQSLTQAWIGAAFGPLPPTVMQALQNFVQKQIDALGEKAATAIGALAAKINAAAGDAASAVLAPLGALGEKIQAQLAAVTGKLNNAKIVGAITKALDDYAQLRESVLEALGDAQRAKVTLALAGSVQNTSSNQTFLRVTFAPTADSDAGRRLFDAMWTGRLDTLVPLIAAARAAGAVVGEPEGWLLLADRRLRTESVKINLFGLNIGDVRTRDSSVSLRGNLTGDVIADGSATAQQEADSYWISRHAQLVMSATKDDAGGLVDFALNGAFSARGKTLDKDQFERMWQALQTVTGGKGGRSLAEVVPLPDDGSLDLKGLLKSAAILLPLSFTGAEFRGFLSAPLQDLRRDLVTFGLRGMESEYARWWPKQTPRLFTLEKARDCLPDFAGDDTALLLAFLDRFPELPVQWRKDADMDAGVYPRLGMSDGLRVKGSPLHLMLGRLFVLSYLLRGLEALTSQCRALEDLLRPVRLETMESVRGPAGKRMSEIASTLARYATSGEALVGNEELVSWPFVALAATIASAAGRPLPGFVACVVLPPSQTGGEDRLFPLIAG